ncbi:response regulator [Rickettsiella endosymbiont of Xylota segnis]|uniref:response regulator n=1 Tax=Rickettsiella endosymbiont of Xylota segnis TaxID=3066238 RepID=UPI0030D5E432
MLTSSITLNELKQELHRPLKTMLGLAVLLDKEVLVSNQKIYLQDLKKCAQGILNFINRWSGLVQEINFTENSHDEVNTISLNTYPFKILLVEDTPIIQVVHKRMLENLGYHVELVDCAEKALYKISETTYDVILMDINLPGMSGIDAAIQIRRLEYQNLPIIALTAFSDKKNYQDCIDAGINAFVTKPISQEKLKNLMDYYINKKMTISS